MSNRPSHQQDSGDTCTCIGCCARADSYPYPRTVWNGGTCTVVVSSGTSKPKTPVEPRISVSSYSIAPQLGYANEADLHEHWQPIETLVNGDTMTMTYRRRVDGTDVPPTMTETKSNQDSNNASGFSYVFTDPSRYAGPWFFPPVTFPPTVPEEPEEEEPEKTVEELALAAHIESVGKYLGFLRRYGFVELEIDSEIMTFLDVEKSRELCKKARHERYKRELDAGFGN